MRREPLTPVLGAVLGVIYIALGLVETVADIGNSDNGFVFWLPALCGGGILVLFGVFRVASPIGATMVVTVGALAGALATFWTVLTPILSITLILLVSLRTRPPTRGKCLTSRRRLLRPGTPRRILEIRCRRSSTQPLVSCASTAGRLCSCRVSRS